MVAGDDALEERPGLCTQGTGIDMDHHEYRQQETHCNVKDIRKDKAADPCKSLYGYFRK